MSNVQQKTYNSNANNHQNFHVFVCPNFQDLHPLKIRLIHTTDLRYDPQTGMTHKDIYFFFISADLFDNLTRWTDPVLTACSYLQPSLPPGRSLSLHKCAQLKRAECLERGSEGPFRAPVWSGFPNWSMTTHYQTGGRLIRREEAFDCSSPASLPSLPPRLHRRPTRLIHDQAECVCM